MHTTIYTGKEKHNPITVSEQLWKRKLCRITSIASNSKDERFNNISHLLLEKTFLKDCFKALKKVKSVGVDKITIKDYASNLDGNLDLLINQLKKNAYKPQPVKRVNIPK